MKTKEQYSVNIKVEVIQWLTCNIYSVSLKVENTLNTSGNNAKMLAAIKKPDFEKLNLISFI